MNVARLLIFFGILLASLAQAAPAQASPRDAELSGLACGACHSVGSSLTGIGRAWAARSNRLQPIGDRPLLAARTNVAYVSDGNGTGLSKVIVDYLDLYLNGKIGDNVSYVVQQHVVDGGYAGYNRDAYLQYRRPRSRYAAGAMALPLPIDPERFRPLHEDYLIFDQTVGGNPFSFGESHPAVAAYSGDAIRGPEFGAFALAGHEAGSGVAQRGTDAAFEITQRMPGLTLFALGYDGRRSFDGTVDAFQRACYVAVADRGPWTLSLGYTRGYDTNAAPGVPATSSAGLVMLHRDLDAHTFLEARYEGIADSLGTFQRLGVIGAGRTLTRNVRITVEDGISRDTRTHNMLHVVTAIGDSNAPVDSASY